ncbi:DUF881 domain-containing protein [Phytoactinopolyspora mesophila]|nr:DUF881 domain-containing protein [Phytoactinopolyspora mesophila]
MAEDENHKGEAAGQAYDDAKAVDQEPAQEAADQEPDTKAVEQEPAHKAEAIEPEPRAKGKEPEHKAKGKEPEHKASSPVTEAPRFRPVAPSGAKRFWRALATRPQTSHLGVGLLVGLLGFAAVVQVRGDEEDALAHARRDELVQILDGLSRQGDRLEDEITGLRRSREELVSGADAESVAMTQAEDRLRQAEIIAGTAPATGPGIQMTISDPDARVTKNELFSAVQELRTADAEAIQIEGVGNDNSVRVVTDTHFLDAEQGVSVSGVELRPTYVITAIGNPVNLDQAMHFPQGVVYKLNEVGAEVTVTQFSELTVDKLHEVREPEFARPAPEED